MVLRLIQFLQRIAMYVQEFGAFRGIQILWGLKSHRANQIRIASVPHPIRLRPRTSDVITFDQIFAVREYDVDLPFSPKTIIDAGANVGYAAIFFAQEYPGATIISIEPEPTNFELLQENTQSYDNIIALQNALHNVSGEKVVVQDEGYGKWGYITKRMEGSTENQTNTVQTIAIHDIMTQYDFDTLDIVKIDIEGFEKELFEKNTELWLPQTRCLIIELHDRMKDGCAQSVFRAISQYDFTFFHKRENLFFIKDVVK